MAELKAQRDALAAQLEAVDQQIVAASPDTREDPEEGVAIHWFIDVGGRAKIRVDTSKSIRELRASTLRRIADVMDALAAFETGGPWPTVAAPEVVKVAAVTAPVRSRRRA